MIRLEGKFNLTPDTCVNPNLADRLRESDRVTLGKWVLDGYNADKASRSRWELRMESALDLALQLQKAKSFPWPECSNVAFPLVTISAMQFHSRAYPALISGTDIVRYRVPAGTADPTGAIHQRAERIGNLMSRQVLEDDPSWEEQHDRALIALPILGSVFIKTYFKADARHNSSDLVLPFDLVMNYFSKSVEACPRKSHVIPLSRNDVYERVYKGVFLNVLHSDWYRSMPQQQPTVNTQRADVRKGETPPPPDENTPFKFIEQHTWFDMDQDGYAEPYTITIEASTGQLVRMVARWERPEDVRRLGNGRIISIIPTEHFTKYSFIPSPDGGIYDLGFGVLLGPLNESVNTMLNQLIDAGTMATTAGGFLGRGAKIRGGNYTFSPFQWNRVDATGDDLRKSMFPLPVREPSSVLFNLLSLLIDFTNRVSGATDISVGVTPGQNTPAETSRNALEQGQKIYQAIFKRVWRSMKGEFSRLYQLNAIHLPDPERKDFLGDSRQVVPVADPNVVSESQRLQRAVMVKQTATATPGYNLEAVERDFLKALHVENVEVIYPGPDKVKPLPNPKLQIETLKMQGKQMELKQKQQEFLMQLMEDRRLNSAKIIQLMAQADKLIAEADGVQAGHKIAAFEAAIGAMKTHNDGLNRRIELMMKGMELDERAKESGDTNPPEGGMGGGAAKPITPVSLPTSGEMGMGAEGGMG